MTSDGKRQIARAASIVMAGFVLSRLLGLGREAAIGYQFGTSRELDAYLAAFRIPDLLFQLIAGGALASAFIPTFTAQLARDDEEGAWRLASAVANLLLILLGALALVSAIAAEPLVRYIIAPGFDPATQHLTAYLMRWMLLATVIFAVSGLCMGVLNARQHFLFPALSPSVYNLSIMAGALLLGPRLGIFGLAWGVVIGASGHLLIQVPALLREGARYRPVLGLRDAGVREVGRLMGPRVLGLAAVQINFLINTILASGLPAGRLSALNYAWLLMLLPQGIFAMAVSTAAFPTFSRLAAEGKLESVRDAFTTTLRTILFLTIPSAVGLVLLRKPLVALLLQRGAFDVSSTQIVAWTLQFYAIGLFAHASVEVTSRAFYALHDTKTPVLISLMAMAVNLGLSLWLIHPLAQGGLALSNSTATILEMILLLILLRPRLGGLMGRELIRSTAHTIFSATVMALALVWWMRSFAGHGVILQAGGGLLVGSAVFLAGSYLVGSREVRYFQRFAFDFLARLPYNDS